jgi:Lon protease-like protein
MSAAADSPFLLPIFPLPNLVFFPKTRVPLHIFEPRYRQMIADALAGDNQIGIVLPRAGWERDYYGSPSVHGCGTVGRIENSVMLDDGRYNVLLHGEVRFRIVDEVKEAAPYRVVRAVAQPEVAAPPAEAYAHREWLSELSRVYLQYLPGGMEVPEIETVGLDALTNALVMSLDLDAEEKQQMLELDDVILRADRVARELKERIETLQFLAPYRMGKDPTSN